ncbi:unnamed protein product [Amaranthus hypochondriacus]
MSTCIPTVADKSAAVTTTTPIASSSLSILRRRHHLRSFSNVVFPLSSKPKLRLFSKNVFTHNVAVKAQLNNAGIGGSSSSGAQSDALPKEVKNGKPSNDSVQPPLASEDSISEFIAQVASLVKLVDSRDIVELQMKQHDCELLIRKKEAIQQEAPVLYAPAAVPSPPQASQPVSIVPTPTAASSSTKASTPATPVPKPAKSSVPPLKSPMAGTFYRSPAPGAPPFVKVGDKVQKGQVVCIIEAMKLMNEIEADQSGTVVEIIAEDGKPVSLDSPLFAIQP